MRFWHNHRQSGGGLLEIQDEKALSSECRAEFLLGQTFHPSCGHIPDAADALGNGTGQAVWSHYAFHQPAARLKPFLGRKFKGRLGNVAPNHAQSSHEPNFKARGRCQSVGLTCRPAPGFCFHLRPSVIVRVIYLKRR